MYITLKNFGQGHTKSIDGSLKKSQNKWYERRKSSNFLIAGPRFQSISEFTDTFAAHSSYFNLKRGIYNTQASLQLRKSSKYPNPTTFDCFLSSRKVI